MKAFYVGLILSVFILSACPKNPDVAVEGLPVKRAVIYRNGVGYFEREGSPDSEKVYFKVRTNKVSDFLATLTVLQEGGSSVKSVSFPTKVEVEPVECKPKMKPSVCKELQKNSGLMKITLQLSDDFDRVRVGYIGETPVWRPSYRLVEEKGKLYLQAWGIVQNISGEDWKDVKLSLVAGSPISFETNLAYTHIPQRPMVSDYGEVISSVPVSETTLAEEPPMAPPPAPSAEYYEEVGAAGAPVADKVVSAPKTASSSPSKKMESKAAYKRQSAKDISGGGGGLSAYEMQDASMMPKNTAQLATIAVEGGQTRYDIPQRVSVPDENSTMVLIFSKKVDGDLSYLFAPEYGVPDSSSHPFRVARFKNTTGGLLEKGPLAIYESKSFLGQGMLSILPADATTTVPFSLERAVAVEIKRNNTERGGRLFKIESGSIMVEKNYVYQTEYKIKNGLDKDIRLFVRHSRVQGSRLTTPTKDVEDNVGTNTALVGANVAKFTTDTLKVEEIKSMPYSVDWMSDMAEDAIKDYISHKKAEPDNVKILKQLLEIRDQLKKSYTKEEKLYQEQTQLERAQNETRANLKAIEKNPQASDLKVKLMERLDKNAARLQIISKELIEVQMRISELKVRFDESKKQIKILEPLPVE